MLEQFIEKSFYQSSRNLIIHANAIAQEYLAKGYSLTLRQLYYQFVARDLLKNTVANYKKLGQVVNDARQAGLIDWALIEDRTRWLREIQNYENPAEFTLSVLHQYAEDLWRDNDTYCEVWVEKDALSGVVARSCDKWRVPYFPCRGYGSQSELYNAGKRIAHKYNKYDRCIIFHLGDHDPSGIDMSRDNSERISMFARTAVDFKRIALNMDQIEEYEPPENPAKETDSRFADYADKFGESSWELDSMPPEVINEILEEHITSVLDTEQFEVLYAEEQENKDKLRRVAYRFDDIVKLIDEPPLTPYALGIPAKKE